MNNQLVFLIALCIAEFLHNSLEVWGMRKKVNWLDRVQNGLDHRREPKNINTKALALIFHFLILALFSSLFFFVLRVMDLPNHTLVLVGIVALLANYASTTWRVDGYHAHIGRLITHAKQKDF